MPEFCDRTRSIHALEELSAAHGTPAVIVGLTGADHRAGVQAEALSGSRPCIVIAVHEASGAACPEWADLVIAANDPMLDAVVATIERAPIASSALAVLLRGGARRSIEDGLAAESAVYSLLQSGPEFSAWRASAAAGLPGETQEEAVICERTGGTLTITLNRPQRHNAFNPAMRDGLSDVAQFAVADSSIERVTLRGAGPSFCSGGDLATFGTFDDPASAHIVRLTRSPARLMAQLAERLGARFEVHLHGACMGAGIELAAFAHRVVARRDAQISLPEVPLGLIPGAGGTVSITARIGPRRTLLLALCGATIDAPTALAWGLIDAIVTDD
jgi:enoyl-CoA hydratase/carnithine racemase